MKKMTRILMLALIAVIAVTLMLGLSGCAKGPDGFATAMQLWNEAESKTVVDDINISATVGILNSFGGQIVINANVEMERKYKADGEVEKITVTIKSIEVSGFNNAFLNILRNMMPEEMNIDDMIVDGKIVMDEFEPLVLEGLSLEGVNLDRPMLYDIEASAVSQDNTASITGAAGLSVLLSQIFALIESELGDNDAIIDIFGGSEAEDLQAYLEDKTDLGDVALAFAYKGKKFNTITGEQSFDLSITKNELKRIINILELNEVVPDEAVNIFGNTINAAVEIKIVSTFKY